MRRAIEVASVFVCATLLAGSPVLWACSGPAGFARCCPTSLDVAHGCHEPAPLSARCCRAEPLQDSATTDFTLSSARFSLPALSLGGTAPRAVEPHEGREQGTDSASALYGVGRFCLFSSLLL